MSKVPAHDVTVDLSTSLRPRAGLVFDRSIADLFVSP